MKRIFSLALALLLLFSLAACGNIKPENTDAPKNDFNSRIKYEYPEEFDPSYSYPMENIIRDTNELYAAITSAYPDRPVLTLILQSYGGGIYPIKLLNAVNTWLEDKGYGFALMIYAFSDAELRNGVTFEEHLAEYIKAGGRCDIIASGPNVTSWARLPGDTIWDYVNDGLIVSLDTVAGEEDLDDIRIIYGDAFIQTNSDNGKIYGFSPATLEAVQSQIYLAVCDSAFPLLENLSTDELVDVIVNDRELVEKIKTVSGKDIALASFPATTPIQYLPAMFLNENYIPINMYPLYIDSNGENPSVVGAWEIPELMEGIVSYVDLVNDGLLSLNASETSAAMFFFSSYPDIASAQSYLDKYLAAVEAEQGYTLIPLNSIVNPNGPECSLFLASASGQKELAFDFIKSALVDKEIGKLLCMGVEGVSYTVENGIKTYNEWIFEPIVYPNNLYDLPKSEATKDLQAFCAELQKSAEFTIFENFNADISGCEEEAAALAHWNRIYIDALQNFGEYLPETEISAESFVASPNPPEIENLRTSILEQLEEYAKYYE